MEFNLLKVLEPLADYLSFLVNFASKPRAALQPYAGKGSIDPKLLSFVAFAVGLSWIISLIANAIGTVDDPSRIIRFVVSFKTSVLPEVALILILIQTH